MSHITPVTSTHECDGAVLECAARALHACSTPTRVSSRQSMLLAPSRHFIPPIARPMRIDQIRPTDINVAQVRGRHGLLTADMAETAREALDSASSVDRHRWWFDGSVVAAVGGAWARALPVNAGRMRGRQSNMTCTPPTSLFIPVS